jgi:hypothetical protein
MGATPARAAKASADRNRRTSPTSPTRVAVTIAPAPTEGEQWMTLDPRLDLSGKRMFLAREGTEPLEATPSELGLDPGESSQESGDRTLMTNGREVGRRRSIAGHEDPKVSMEPVANASHLEDHVLARPHQELEVQAPVCQPDGWQVGLPEGHPRDRHRIARVALAGPPRADPFASRELRWHLPDRAPGSDQEPGCRRPEARRSLDADDGVRVGRQRPVEQRPMTCGIVIEDPLRAWHTQRVDDTRRECRLVGIDPDGTHPLPSAPLDTMDTDQVGSSASR